jgi:hypothetical protein
LIIDYGKGFGIIIGVEFGIIIGVGARVEFGIIVGVGARVGVEIFIPITPFSLAFLKLALVSLASVKLA